MMPNHSVSSCADACTCPSLCPCVPADVAANLTNLAIIVQRAPWQGCWREGATRWRSLRSKCAERLELEFPPNSTSGTWTWLSSTILDGRRLEVVADGLTLWHGAQFAIDATLVSPLRRDGSPRAADHGGAALDDSRRRKERTYPELSGDGGRARYVVLTVDHPTCCRAGFSKTSS